jgi:predicted MFS family arabinose efflux permease
MTVTGSQRTILAVLVGIGVCYVYANIVMAALLLQLSAEFGITLAAAGLVTAAFAVPGIVVPIFAGPYSDRYGRKRFLVTGTAVLGIGMLAAAAAPSFGLLVVFRAVAGIGGALCISSLVAAVADASPYRERGRAIALLSAANAGVTIIGIPIAGILAEATSWRASVGLIGVLAVIAAGIVAIRLPRSSSSPSGITLRGLYTAVLEDRSALLLLAVAFSHFVGSTMWGTFLVVFLQTAFTLPQGVASTLALTSGLGFLVGSQAGGRYGDRIGHQWILASGLVVGAGAVVAITLLPIGLPFALAMNVALGAALGARAVSHPALLTARLPRARATLLALSNSVGRLSDAFGATLGGILIASSGFWLLGLACAATFLLGLALLAPVSDSREAIESAA